MSPSAEIHELQAEADYYHDRVALLRAKRYRWGLGSNARLRALERRLADAQERVRDAQRQAIRGGDLLR